MYMFMNPEDGNLRTCTGLQNNSNTIKKTIAKDDENVSLWADTHLTGSNISPFEDLYV